MKNTIPEEFYEHLDKIREPDNLFSGLRMNPNFCLPDNLLIFYHNWTEPKPNAHGRCTIVIPLDDMVYYIERKKIIIRPGDAVCIPPFAQRFLRPDSKGYRRFFITFELRNVTYFEEYFGVYRLTENSWTILWNFLDSFAAAKPEESSMRLMDFMNSWENRPINAKSNVIIGAKLEQALEYIQTHLGYISGLWGIAKHCNLSESHLRSLFKHEFGISLGKYVARQRIETAKYLLKNTQSPIGEIAMKTGFSNQFVFSSFFRRNTGISPSQFRKVTPSRIRSRVE